MLPGPAVAGPGVLRRCMARWRCQQMNVADDVGYGMGLPCTPHDVRGCSSGIILM
ncbi:hypothetical protein ACWWAH_02895 [Xylella fastidiosa subsp. pauca]